MEDFKDVKKKVLAREVEKLSSQQGPVNIKLAVTNTEHFLANMPPKKFKKLVQKAQKEGDKETTAALLTNWPFNKK